MAFQVFTGNSNGYDCMPQGLFLDSTPSPTNSDNTFRDSLPSPTSSDNTFRDMVKKYLDPNDYQYGDDAVLPTAPLPDQSCSSPTGLQTTNLLGRLPWHTSLADMFESHVDFLKVLSFFIFSLLL